MTLVTPFAVAVALLAEGVDRNFEVAGLFVEPCQVALLAEGVDRNRLHLRLFRLRLVALLAEGVDRNCLLVNGLVES